MKVVWSPLALKRAQDISANIAMDKPSAAKEWIHGLFKAVARLDRYPESGRIVPEVQRTDVRELVYNAYRVIYRMGNEISVLTVIHGRQQLEAAVTGGSFGEEPEGYRKD